MEISLGNMESYESDFVVRMCDGAAVYSLWKASNWIAEESCPDYMSNAEECLKREKDKVAH